MFTRWPQCVTHTFPKGVTKYIADGMPLVKYKPSHIETVQSYITDHILTQVRDILDDQTKGVSHYYMVLDRGKNIAKALFTHPTRNKKVVVMEDPTGYPFVIPPNGFLPKQWEALLANRELTRREVYPLFYRALIETYKPPSGKCVTLDGAPIRPVSKQEYEDNGGIDGPTFKTAYFSRVLDGQGMEMSQSGILATPRAIDPLHYKGPAPQDWTHDCVEGDLSAFVYVNKHFRHAGNNAPHVTNDAIMLDTNDGDTVMIALLHARDRIDPVTGKFVNRVWVKLRGQKSTRDAYLKRKADALAKKVEWKEDVIDGRDMYVNINMLYIEIDLDVDLRIAPYPVLIAVTLHILGGTDFFGDFMGDDHALFFDMGWEKYVWDTWCQNAAKYSHMIMMFYSGETTFNQPELLRKVYIHEPDFVAFYYQCYAAKYAAAIRKEYGDDVAITPTLLEEFTGRFAKNCKRKPNEPDEKYGARLRKARKKRVPPEGILIRYIRILLGNVLYWINDYRPGGHLMFDPLETYLGFSYYGFVRDETTGHITLSSVCAPAKPVPEYCLPYIERHKKAVAAAKAAKRAPVAVADSPVSKSGLPKLPVSASAPVVAAKGPTPAERIKKKNELDAKKRERQTAFAPKPIQTSGQKKRQKHADP